MLIIISFLTLTITGMALKFPDNLLFASITHSLGGPHVMGTLHRIGAIITFIYFGAHLLQLAVLFMMRKITIKGLIKEEYSLIPLPRDLKDLKDNILYFIGKGPKPAFGRWTYWEKFDYMAVFWGVIVIGSTGLILWFPVFFTMLLPGWAINVAQIIHSDEALLAVGFIFTIHFFNTHLRPESFPMDTVIFTGHVPYEEYKDDRPREFEQLEKTGKLETVTVEKEYSKRKMRIVRFFGFIFLLTGVTLVVFILYSLLAG